MAITLTSGSASIAASEHSLFSNVTASGSATSSSTTGIYQLFLDCASMVAGDQFAVRYYEKVAAASGYRLIEEHVLSGAQSKPMFTTPALILGAGFDWTVTGLSSSARGFVWSIRKVA